MLPIFVRRVLFSFATRRTKIGSKCGDLILIILAQVGSCTAIELVGDSTNSINENTFLEREQNESIADLITVEQYLQFYATMTDMTSIY